MSVITIKRTARRQDPARSAVRRRPICELSRKFFANEHPWEFAVEALFFAVLLAISAWPIAVAASAINDLLQGRSS